MVPIGKPSTLLNDDKTVTCPYNPAHQVLRKSFHFHLVRCKRNYPNSDLVVCPFNSIHYVSISDLEGHKRTCPSRGIVDEYALAPEENALPSPMINSFPPPPPPSKVVKQNVNYADEEEDWESELVNSTYDPAKACKGKIVLRAPRLLTKSQRRQHEKEEDVRHQELHEQYAQDEEY